MAYNGIGGAAAANAINARKAATRVTGRATNRS